MADDLPIDIDYAKFLDWLVDRRRVARNWHASLKAARVLLRSAGDALPGGATLAPPTTYHELKDTLTLLEDKSAAEPFPGARDTDMLGRYSHPASRAWKSARSSYEGGSAYLAEAAQALVRAADVEAPAIRGDMARLKDAIADCARREGPTSRAAADAKARFEDACAEFDIASSTAGDFEGGVRAYVESEAPAFLRAAVDGAKDGGVAEALVYYAEFMRYCGGELCSVDGDGEEVESAPDAVSGEEALCSTLREVAAGDPDDLVRPEKNDAQATECLDAGNDWGITSDFGAGAAGGEATIDWGIEIDGTGADADTGADAGADAVAEAGVDLVVPPENDAEQEGGIAAGGIDWGVLEAVQDGSPGDGADATAAETASGVTLASSETREKYMTDLLELRAFLVQRNVELSRPSDSKVSLVLQQYGNVPDSVRKIDSSRMQEMSDAVDRALDCIAGQKVRRILGLQSSRDEVSRCARDLSQKMHAFVRLEGSIDALAKRKLKASEELRELQPKFDDLAGATRKVIQRTESELSALYKGREVNILGEINVIFPDY